MSLSISELTSIEGFIGACLIDTESGLMLASEDGTGQLDLEVAGAANLEVVRAKNAAMKSLGLEDSIEDILISLGGQYHLIRPLSSNSGVFVYVALDRKRANLGMARLSVKKVESGLEV